MKLTVTEQNALENARQDFLVSHIRDKKITDPLGDVTPGLRAYKFFTPTTSVTLSEAGRETLNSLKGSHHVR